MNAPTVQRSLPLVLGLSCCLGLANLARGQTAATTSAGASADIPALRVAVTSVNESRNSQGRGAINLNLSIVGEGLPPTAAIRQIKVTKAVDNLGNVLGSSTSGASAALSASMMRSRMMSNLARGRGGVGPLTGEAALDASVRQAESLTYAEGTIELFLPSEANGSIVRIPNVLNHAGRIEDPGLARHGIEFHFLPDQASYDEAEASIAGFRTPPRVPDFPNGVGYFLRDPSGLIADRQFQQAAGAMIASRGHSRSGGTGAIHLSAPLPADAQLVLFLAIPEAIKTVPFRVEDIALP